jgi:hypothetical protein
MSATAAAGSEKTSDVAAASLLTSLKAVEEHIISTDAVNLSQKKIAAEEYHSEDEEEELNLASALIPDILEKSRDLP